jgi:hypothetical protein
MHVPKFRNGTLSSIWLKALLWLCSSAWQTLHGIEPVNMIRKARVRWVVRQDPVAEADFIHELFGIAANIWHINYCGQVRPR